MKAANGTSSAVTITSANASTGTSAITKDKTSYKYQHQEPPVLQKLFSSQEEKTNFIPHLHKTLGVVCLASYAYRFANIGQQDANFGPDWGTIIFIALHLSLNVSAFVFAIPQRRIRDGGYRIWPEYRIHSLVFASRHLALMFLRWYEQTKMINDPTNATSREPYYAIGLGIVLATCAAADFGSYLQGPHRSNTVRGATFADPFENWFASEMQLILTAFCLVGYERYTIHLVGLFNIQVNAFLMTLRRKNVAPHYALTTCYTGMLLISLAALSLDDYFALQGEVAVSFGCIAAILRMGPLHLNKYILWTFLGLVYYYVRQSSEFTIRNDAFWLKTFTSTKLISTMLGVHKRSKAPKETRSQKAGILVLVLHVLYYSYLYMVNFILWF